MGAYWPDGVTMPQHLWPFFQTGDYSDQGSTGGLTLTAQGSGNSFDANGLVLNGSGYASVTSNADVNDLGSTFSIMMEVSYDNINAFYTGIFRCSTNESTTGYETYKNNAQPGHWFLTFDSGGQDQEDDNVYNDYGLELGSGEIHQYIWVYDSGYLYRYIDGVPSSANPATLDAPDAATGATLYVGTITYWNLVGKIKRFGILKGTAWTSDEVADIYAWEPTVGGQPYRKRLGGIPYAALNKGVW